MTRTQSPEARQTKRIEQGPVLRNIGMIAGHLSRLSGICCIDCITDKNKKGNFRDLALSGCNVGISFLQRYSLQIARSAEVCFT